MTQQVSPTGSSVSSWHTALQITPTKALPTFRNVTEPAACLRKKRKGLTHVKEQTADCASKRGDRKRCAGNNGFWAQHRITRFEFRDTFAQDGAQFDPTLGDFGGLRVTGFIDGLGDEERGDVDAAITVNLLLTEANGMPDPEKPAEVLLKMETNDSDNSFRVDDRLALGIPAELEAGDANRDLSFDQRDLVQVLQRAKYLTGRRASWGDGDWNGAPDGSPGSPPVGDGVFDQKDIVTALQNGLYLKGRYAASIDVPTSASTIPEPASVVLTGLAMLVVTGFGTRRNRQKILQQ